MSDELNLQPARPLPPEIRDRIRQRLDDGIRNDERRGPQRGKLVPLLAAAATVTALAAGVVLIGGPGELPVTGPNAELDRCWQAIANEGKGAEYPNRKTWRLVGSVRGIPDRAAKLLAIRADGDPLFCGLTTTTVTVSPPDLPTDTGPFGVRPILELPYGMIGGIAGDLSALRVGISSGPMSGSSPAEVSDGLFLQRYADVRADRKYSFVDADLNALEAVDAEGIPLPEPVAPEITFVDRPGRVAERTSPEAKRLRLCFGDFVFPGRDSWAAGATVATADGKHVVARRGNNLGLCKRSGNGYVEFMPAAHERVANDTTPIVLHVSEAVGVDQSEDDPALVLWGTVDDAVVKVEITDVDGQRYRADASNSTFATFFRPGKPLGTGMMITPPRAKAYNADGKLIWSGRLEPTE